MSARDPMTHLATHDVSNQVPPLENINLFEQDVVLRDAVAREGAGWAETKLRALGATLGGTQGLKLGEDANRHPPELRAFDRSGQRIDEVEYHPAYHALMGLGFEYGVPSIAWTANQSGGHVAHAAMEYLFSQVEAGVCCPMTMTYAAVPALRVQPEIAGEWEPRLTSSHYDSRMIPATEKTGATLGMAMTEKQGGSDLRANTTTATAINGGGPGGEYLLHGHKWFCSAPMSDAFLTLAQTEKGLSCFLVPRWRPDGTRNTIFIQRLKEKLGNRANASSEIEYHDSWARMLGEEGRGVKTIIEMVHHTRLDTCLAPAGLMRQAVTQASHHAAHRSAFQKHLNQHPLMQNVLADLAIESEAASVLVMRVARAFDESSESEGARLFARIAVAIAKYWINKRAPNLIYEAMECLGGAGYVEDSILPRLYREAPLNSIWEGSGNVICLDVLRAMQREPESIYVLLDEIEESRSADRRLGIALDRLKDMLTDPNDIELRARRITEQLAICLQGAVLLKVAPPEISDAFCASRLSDDWGRSYGTLPTGVACAAIAERSRPKL
ncbi:acyl-CoA dehydrogenase family protein [Pelagibius sp. Alg239-R121]|uniref:acyl-CoA dehydrogenase family protein n=1 Tax=Pelagibius sp. Alg239-R121 TaxID=2993448 RepID=UPI0024A6AE3B|nr:acyl-CoA dehydrogenase family protein [Pelagibius sp. Alg239-R121]